MGALLEPAELTEPLGQYAARPLGLTRWRRFGRTLLMLIGAGVAFAVAWSNPDHDEPPWRVWAAVATLLGALSGSAFGSGIARRREVDQIRRVSSWKVAPAVMAFVMLAVVAVAASWVYVRGGLSWRGVAFASIAVLGAVPAGATLAAIRSVAMKGITGTPGEQLIGLIKLRRLLARVLRVLGTLLVVLVLVQATALGWGNSEAQLATSAVVFTGAAGTVLIGLMYIPTSALLRRRCGLFIDDFTDLATAEPGQLVAALEERVKLEDLMGVNHTTLGELQAGLVIVAPLLAGAAAAVLPKF